MNLNILSGRKAKPKVKVIDLGKKGKFNIRKGALHRALGITEGTKIPHERIVAALKDKRPEVRKMARSALGLEGMRKQ